VLSARTFLSLRPPTETIRRSRCDTLTGMRVVAWFTLMLAMVDGTASAQPPPAGQGQDGWSLDVGANTYIVHDSENYLQPAVAADHGWLHLEARFNYEDRDTGSIWLGYNFSVGEEVALEITPMIGAVIGNTAGVAPGYKASLRWRMVDLYSETEYVVDAGESTDSFLYTWSEFALAPADWVRFGLAVQRTKVYRTPFDIQRGFFAGFSYRRSEVAAYVFDPDASPTVVIAISVGF
jgi:hypothetical protein